MSDEAAILMREVEEDIQREKMEAMWKKWGGVIVTAAVLTVAGVAGSVWYQNKTQAAQMAGTQQLLSVPDTAVDEPAKQAELYGKISADLTGEQAVLARMLEAGALVMADKHEDGAKLYFAVADDKEAPAYLRHAATVQGASAAIGHMDPETITAKLEPMLSRSDKWQPMAMEMAALAELQRNTDEGKARAKELLTGLAAHKDATPLAHNRAKELLRGLAQGVMDQAEGEAAQ